MIVSGVTNSAKQEFLQGIHTPGDNYMIALYDEGAALDASVKIYSSAGEVTGKGYEAGGIILSGHTVSVDGDTAILSFKDAAWPNATINARGAVIYNASKENRAIAIFDFEENQSSTNGEFTLGMPPATSEKGLIRIS